MPLVGVLEVKSRKVMNALIYVMPSTSDISYLLHDANHTRVTLFHQSECTRSLTSTYTSYTLRCMNINKTKPHLLCIGNCTWQLALKGELAFCFQPYKNHAGSLGFIVSSVHSKSFGCERNGRIYKRTGPTKSEGSHLSTR